MSYKVITTTTIRREYLVFVDDADLAVGRVDDKESGFYPDDTEEVSQQILDSSVEVYKREAENA